jgi:alkylated DNA repair dioxygenase AlkB
MLGDQSPHPTVEPEFIINQDDKSGTIAVILRGWLPEGPAQRLHDDLARDLPWEQKEQNFYGNVVRVPRLMCAIGEPSLQEYKYTRVALPMHNWNDNDPLFREVRHIRDRIQTDPQILRIVGQALSYDGCLLNQYKDGDNTIDFHSDREALDQSESQ